jgi:hypothetical protein
MSVEWIWESFLLGSAWKAKTDNKKEFLENIFN